MGLPKKIAASAAQPIDLRAEFVAGSAKSAIYRIDEIRQEVINAVQAMKAGFITPQQAIDWIESVAPGCLGYMPPLTGLGLKRDEGDSE
jgi:hypothetical protein